VRDRVRTYRQVHSAAEQTVHRQAEGHLTMPLSWRGGSGLQVAFLDHACQRVVLDSKGQIDAPPPPAALVDGEDDFGGVERQSRAQLRLAPRQQGVHHVGDSALHVAGTVQVLAPGVDVLPIHAGAAHPQQRAGLAAVGIGHADLERPGRPGQAERGADQLRAAAAG